MKKKNIIILIFLIILIISIFLVINNRVLSREDDIISKGNRIFGTDYCPKKNNDDLYEDYNHPMMAGQAFTPYKCKICNKKYEHHNTAIPKICSSCADITGRCMQCGKLKKVSEQ